MIFIPCHIINAILRIETSHDSHPTIHARIQYHDMNTTIAHQSEILARGKGEVGIEEWGES